LITGGASGIGRASAIRLATDGLRLALADIDASRCTLRTMEWQAPPARPMLPGLADWRPQRFGSGNVKSIRDPIIEPRWDGIRTLVQVGFGTSPAIFDEHAQPVDDVPEVAAALTAAARASSLVLDGYLTRQATRAAELLPNSEPHAPTAGEMTAQLFLGAGGRRRRRQEIARVHDAEVGLGPLAFVAVDLLAVDDDHLLNVPLLERKRLLEAVLDEGELVRRTAFVRPPVDPWLGTWRSLGFFQLAYKAANSRYLPGAVNPGWATVVIPQR
jgi:hypothetical protein